MKSIYSKIGFLILGLSLVVIPAAALAAPTTTACSGIGEFKSMLTGSCLTSYNDWIKEVWTWSLAVIIPLSTLMLTAAGIIYMTSGGNPDRVKIAKKMTIGVASGIALIVLSSVLFKVLGIDPWNILGSSPAPMAPSAPSTSTTPSSSPSGSGGGFSGGGGSGGGGGGFSAD